VIATNLQGEQREEGLAPDGALPQFAVIVPAKNAQSTLDEVLPALKRASPAPSRIIVYADGCTDQTAQIAASHGAHVVVNDGPSCGPAVARNEAAALADEPLIAFVDADVVVEPDAFAHLHSAMQQHESSAAFGAYGSVQACANIAARYANLRHHFFHVNGDASAETFWTGLGMVRRQVFDELGGFDANISRPAMEDIEFGFRMRRAGHTIRIAADARGTHLKNWTLRQLWHDDVVSRAIPWSRMIIDGDGPATLNAAHKEQIKAGFALSVLGFACLSLLESLALIPAGFAAFCYFATNFKFLRKIREWSDGRTMLASIGLHYAYYIYSSAAYVMVFVERRLLRAPIRVFRRIRAGLRNRTQKGSGQA